MSTNLRKIIVRMSTLAIYAMIVCYSFSMALAVESTAQRKQLSEITVEVSAKKSNLLDVLKQVEKDTDFTFAYSRQQLKGKSIDLEAGSWKMDALLKEISVQAGISLRRVNETITIKEPGQFESPEVTEAIFEQQQITGKVTDEQGEALPGASVIVTGTTTGTVTDIDGTYSLSVPGGATTLDISFVGMETQTVDINGRSVIDVKLSADIGQLEEVVVIGFGTRQKKDLTGSIATVDSKTIEKTSFLSPQYALQGNAPGVRVLPTSGDPNAQPQIQVRGIGTWNGRAQPLYVIDGLIINDPSDYGNEDVIAGGGRVTPLNLWNLINPGDIESISVLKDASAAAIYGSRAANGVVLITTRKGKKGAPTVEFSSNFGWATVPQEDRLLNTKQYADVVREAYTNSDDPSQEIGLALYGDGATGDIQRLNTFSPQFDPSSPYFINENTAPTYDWQDYLLRTALDQTYDIKLSGGSERTNYYVSLGLKDQEHPHVGNEARRYTGTFNINMDITDWLKGGITYKYANSKNRTQEETMGEIVGVAPWQPVYSDDPNRSTGGFAHVIMPPDSAWSPLRIYGQGGAANHLAQMSYNLTRFDFERSIAIGYLELTPLKGLKIRGSINLDQTEQNRFTIGRYAASIFSETGQDPTTINPNAPQSQGSIGDRTNWFNNYQADLSVSYTRDFGKHNMSLTFVAQDTYRKQHYRNQSGSNIIRFNPIDYTRTGYGNDQLNNGAIKGYNDAYWFGYVGRGSYNYDSKYYLDLSFRRDASSGFDKDYRWGNFYSVAGAWRISSESFMDGLSLINDLKLRGGYGEAGNDEAAVGNFAFLSRVSSSGSVRFGSGPNGTGDSNGNYSQLAILTDFPNYEISWEVVKTINFAFDAVMFDNRLNLTTEIYRRTTDGILQTSLLPFVVGTDNPILNLGALKNEGVDIDLGWNDNIGQFSFGVSANGSFLRNEVTKLYQDQPLYASDPFDGPDRRIEIGRSIGHIWGYVVEGIYQTPQEVSDRADVINDQIGDVNYTAPGDLYFKNLGGNPDSVYQFYSPIPDTLLNTYDQTEIGNNLPSFTYGINLTANWKGIDASVSFYGEAGAEDLNTYRRNLEYLGGNGGNRINTVLNRWTPENPNTDMPRAIAGDPARNNRLQSTRWLESKDYFRLNNWQVGYTLPQTLLSKLNGAISSARFYVGGRNNLLLTRWSGLDPVNDNRPLPRTFLVGFNVKF